MAKKRAIEQNDDAEVQRKLMAALQVACHTGKWQPLLSVLLSVPRGVNRFLVAQWIERFSPFWVPIYLPFRLITFIRNPDGRFDLRGAVANPFWTMEAPKDCPDRRRNRRSWVSLVPGGLPSLGKRS